MSIYSKLQLHFSRMQAFNLISSESDYEPTFHSFPESTRKLFVTHSNSHIFRCILRVSCAVLSYLQLTLISDRPSVSDRPTYKTYLYGHQTNAQSLYTLKKTNFLLWVLITGLRKSATLVASMTTYFISGLCFVYLHLKLAVMFLICNKPEILIDKEHNMSVVISWSSCFIML